MASCPMFLPRWISAPATKTHLPMMTAPDSSRTTTTSWAPHPRPQTQYDANGNLQLDGNYSYTWDAENRPASLIGVSVITDALGRIVETNTNGTIAETVYSPSAGKKLAIMSGQTLSKSYVPLPG